MQQHSFIQVFFPINTFISFSINTSISILNFHSVSHSVLETIDECEMVLDGNTTANATETETSSFPTTTSSSTSAMNENGNNETKKFVSRKLLEERPRLPDRFHQCQLTITT